MSGKILDLLGLMRKANAIEIGETNAGSAVSGGRAKLLLLARDASDNAGKRAANYITGRSALLVPLPFTKEEISAHVGCAGCSMAAVTDMGFANALMKALAQQWPDRYASAAAETEKRHAKAESRKSETKAHEKNKRMGKGRTNI